MQWYELVKLQILQAAPKLQQKVSYHMINSAFYFLKMRNEFKSLFELFVAEQMKPSLSQSFQIYRMKKRIERVIFSKHERFTSESKKINVLNLYQYEQNLTYFDKLIVTSCIESIKFWSELLDKQLNVIKLHEIGIKISTNHKKIS